MDANEKNNSNGENNSVGKITTLVRAVICVAVMAVIILNWVGIIGDIRISITISTVLLCGVTMWNGIEALKSKRTGSAVLNFVLFAILALLCVAAFILH